MKKLIKQIRQGDILLQRIDKLPKELKKKNNILAYGEATGHHHRFESGDVSVYIDNGNQQYVEILQDTEIIHEEHGFATENENRKVTPTPKGIYRVVQQREHDVVEGIRQVMD